jgi:hypothetical protein
MLPEIVFWILSIEIASYYFIFILIILSIHMAVSTLKDPAYPEDPAHIQEIKEVKSERDLPSYRMIRFNKIENRTMNLPGMIIKINIRHMKNKFNENSAHENTSYADTAVSCGDFSDELKLHFNKQYKFKKS